MKKAYGLYGTALREVTFELWNFTKGEIERSRKLTESNNS